MSELAAVLDEAWTLLEAGVEPGRGLVTLCTVDAQGAPQGRTVVLREVSRDRGAVAVYTDARSHKLAEIGAEPRVALVLWVPEAKVQLRLTGRAQVEPGLAELWRDIPEDRREPYSHEPSPGTPIPAADAWEEQPAREKFARLTVTLSAIEHVSLADTGHSRAVFRAEQWRGTWLSP